MQLCEIAEKPNMLITTESCGSATSEFCSNPSKDISMIEIEMQTSPMRCLICDSRRCARSTSGSGGIPAICIRRLTRGAPLNRDWLRSPPLVVPIRLLSYCFPGLACSAAGVMRHTVLPTSSATSNAPARSTATPTGRPRASPDEFRKPLRMSIGMPLGRPSANGTNTTL